MKRLIKKIVSILNTINRWVTGSLVAVGGAILAVFAVVIALAIIGRIFGWSVMWMEEYTAYYMLTISSLGLAYAARQGAHVKIDLVVSRLPKRARSILEYIYLAVIFVFVVFLAKVMYGWFSYAWTSGMGSLQTQTPQN